MIRAAKLEPALYEEVEHDAGATVQAMIVVAGAMVLAGLGSVLLGSFSVKGLLVNACIALVWWVVWAVATWLVGTKVFGGTADVGEMLRVLGFAFTPMCLGIIPWIGWLIGLIWTLACGVVAVRQGLDLPMPKAIATILVAALPGLLVGAAINAILF
jgi:hypothetical protein